jgi:PAS domain S-box-containing protein
MANKPFVDYYELLQVSPNADIETIEGVYHILAKRYDPDNPKTGDADRYKILSEAYQVISNFEKRASYDAECKEAYNWPARLIHQREKEVRHNQFLENAPVAIYEVDLINMRFINVNDAMCEYTGYTKDELLSLSPYDILLGESKMLFSEWVNKVLAGEKASETVEYRIHTKERNEIVCERGLPKSATVVVSDITERKRAEEVLRASQEKYRFLVDNVHEGVFIIQDGVIKFPNQRAQEIFGYNADELARIPFVNLIHPKDRFILTKIREKLLKGTGGDQVTYSIRVLTRGIQDLWVQIDSVPIIWEGCSSILNFVKDITKQRMIEEGLKKSVVRLRKITGKTIQAMAGTIAVRDPYTAKHQTQVSDLARSIATRMGLSSNKIDVLRMASVVHDIGKISVPSEILTMPRYLKEIEFNLIKAHPQVGFDILKKIDFPCDRDIPKIVLQHHERFDGSGYPNGLKGDRILIEAKIVMVSDVVEAMANHRPYREALGIEKALEEISKKKGTAFDPDVVDTCLELFRRNDFSFKGQTTNKEIKRVSTRIRK